MTGKWLDNHGYIISYKPQHHFARKGGVREHRLIWEEHYNAILLPWANVHHINGNKQDNRIENLNAMTNWKHTTIHNLGTKHSEETKKRIGLKSIGRFKSEEVKQRIRQSMSGKNNPNYGKHISAEQKQVLREYRTGRKMSEETKQKISASLKITNARMKRGENVA